MSTTAKTKHKPFSHVVRIVVVPKKAVSSSRERHGPRQHEGLTDQELITAKKALKKIDAGEPTNRSSKASGSMFDVLTPTDIVVIGREAASVRVLDKDGKPVPRDESGRRASGSTAAARGSTRRVSAHDDRHKDTGTRSLDELRHRRIPMR